MSTLDSELVLQKQGSLIGREKYRLGDRASWLIATNGENIIPVNGLEEKSGVAIYLEANRWLAMAVNTKFVLNGETVTSARLQSEDVLCVGDAKFEIVAVAASLRKGQESKASPKSPANKSRLVLAACLVATLSFLVLVIAKSGKNEPKASDSSDLNTESVVEGVDGDRRLDEADNRKFVSAQSENADNKGRDQSRDGIDAQSEPSAKQGQEVSTQQQGAYEHYRTASNYYDLGYLQRAIQTLQAGLLAYPNDTILANKLDDWQRSLALELSRQFRDGCLHAKYFRNLEAKHAFAMVVEMSLNESDIRVVEAKRLLTKLKQNSINKVKCGRSIDEN